MKKINRSGILMGLVSGAAVFLLPAAVAQEGPPGPATEIMDGVDANLSGPSDRHPMPMAAMPGPIDPQNMFFNMPAPPPGMGMPGMPPMMPPGGPLQGQASVDGPSAEDVMAMNPNADVMMLRAAVHGQFTDEQLEKIFQVKSKFMDAAGPKMAELKAAHRALYDQLT